MTFLLYFLSLFPLGLFVVLLLWMDSFSLTNGKRLTFSALNGAIACLVILSAIHLCFKSIDAYELYIAPVFEEVLKGSIILYLVLKGKTILVGDTTIYGAAVGAGYGIVENIFLLSTYSNGIDTGAAIMYGFEAAVMHIGCTSTLSMMLAMAIQGRFGNKRSNKVIALSIAFLLAILIHFLHIFVSQPDSIIYIPPIVMTILLVIYFVFSKWSLFRKNERAIHHWIDNCINNDVALLASIKKGELSTTHAGQYLLNIKKSIPPEVFFDICCFISEYLELSIAAKSNLILKEAGLPIVKIENSSERIKELQALQKRIGKMGMATIEPIVQLKEIDRWATKEMI